MTKVLPCDCKHPFQDERYGKGNRVHNFAGKGDKKAWKCTVCSKSKPYSEKESK